MQTTVKLPLYLSWRQLKDIVGWPYSRTQTGRLMFDPNYAHDAFPACRKLGTHRNSHPIWYTPAILDYFTLPCRYGFGYAYAYGYGPCYRIHRQ
jgi:hypothetical protein